MHAISPRSCRDCRALGLRSRQCCRQETCKSSTVRVCHKCVWINVSSQGSRYFTGPGFDIALLKGSGFCCGDVSGLRGPLDLISSPASARALWMWSLTVSWTEVVTSRRTSRVDLWKISERMKEISSQSGVTYPNRLVSIGFTSLWLQSDCALSSRHYPKAIQFQLFMVVP